MEGASTAEVTDGGAPSASADHGAADGTEDGAEGQHRKPPLSPLHVGIIAWLASDVMFFAGLFATWFVLRAENTVWPPAGVELDVVRSGVFTLVLVSSSVTVHFCVKASEGGDKSAALGWMVTTFVLGAVFLTNQLLEYASLDFGLDSHAYGSIYYLLTGFHALHVFGGLCLMIALLFMLAPRQSKAPLAGSVTAYSYYWHFVDVVWVLVFIVVYLIA